jgi:hypothetical protein
MHLENDMLLPNRASLALKTTGNTSIIKQRFIKTQEIHSDLQATFSA